MNVTATELIITAVREAREAKLDISFTVEDIGQPTERITVNAYGAPPATTAKSIDRIADAACFSDGIAVEEMRPIPGRSPEEVIFHLDMVAKANGFAMAHGHPAQPLPRFCLGETVYMRGRVTTVAHHDEGRPSFTVAIEDCTGEKVEVYIGEDGAVKEADPRLAVESAGDVP